MTARPVRSGPLGLLLALALMPATGHATGPPDASSTTARTAAAACCW